MERLRSVPRRPARTVLLPCAAAALLVFAAVAVLLTASWIIASRDPAGADRWAASPDWYAVFRDFSGIEARIRRISAPSRGLQKKVLDRIPYGRATFAVHALCFAQAKGTAAKARVLLAAGVHGNEPSGVEALLRFAAELSANPGLYPTLAVDILPVVNPWGWSRDLRYNAKGRDINRDFASRRTREARAVRAFVRSRGPYALFLDLHESRKGGYFIYQYLPDAQGYGQAFSDIVRLSGQPREDAYTEAFFKAEDGILTIPPVALVPVFLAGRLSFEHWMRLGGTRHAYTVETPMDDAFEDRVAVHLRTIRAFLKKAAEQAAEGDS